MKEPGVSIYDLSDAESVDRQEEEAREQRWAEFIEWARRARTETLLRHVADLMEGRRDPYYIRLECQGRLLSFQETEGWDGVLNAMARAMREEEAYRKELVDRR